MNRGAVLTPNQVQSIPAGDGDSISLLDCAHPLINSGLTRRCKIAGLGADG
jgi:hypothetical protein